MTADRYQATSEHVGFPARDVLRHAVIELLDQGPLLSRNIEEALEKQFGITEHERQIKLGNGVFAWRNHIAWALADLVTDGSIARLRTAPAEDGGTTGLYQLQGA